MIIPGSSLILPKRLDGNVWWVDGDDPNGNGTAGTNGGAVSAVTDKSSTGANLSQGTGALQPAYSNNAQNGRNAISFGASAETYLDSTAFNIGANYTLFIALKASSTASGGHFFDLTTNTNPDPYGRANAAADRFGCSVWSGSADRGFIDGVIVADTPFIVSYTYDSSNNVAQQWIDGVSQGTATNSNYSASASLARRLGSHPTNHFYFKGLFFEIIIFNRVLSTWERQAMQFYLSAKWNIAVS